MIPKFRAWLKDAKEMVDVIEIDLYNEEIFYIYNDYENQEQIRLWAKFDDIELMQSTGLKDKNGIEIFEGYLIKGRGGVLSVVRYIEENACFMATNKAYGSAYIPKGYLNKYTEVVGNIYENSELLEEEE